jgi:hypothetical protein
MGVDQLAHCIQTNQWQCDHQNNFFIGQVLWKHGDLTP